MVRGSEREVVCVVCRKVEDLQFQLEEQGVISGDKLEVVEEGTQQKMAELEGQLAREREETSRLRLQLQTQVLEEQTYSVIELSDLQWNLGIMDTAIFVERLSSLWRL